MDVRIDPEVSTATVAGAQVEVSALHLGGTPRGAVAVLAGPDGLDAVTAVDTMNHLAQHGYESVLAVAPDEGSGAALVDHLVGLLAERDWEDEQIGLLGYGLGARTVLEAAAARTYGAAVSVPRDSRSLLRPQPVPAVHTPWLGMVGLGGQTTLGVDLAAYRDALALASSQYTRLVGYPGAESCLRDSTIALEHAAAFDAWQRTAEWLNIHVAPRPTPLARAWQERQRSLQPSAS